MDQDKFLKLFEELLPFKHHLAGNTNYKALRFTYEDILGFFDEKLLHVFTKYSHLPYEEIKALSISSLYTMRARLYRQYGKEVPMEEESWVPNPEEIDYHAQLEHLLENLKKVLTKQQWVRAKLLFMPPIYVLAKTNNSDARIPSHLFLEFLGIEPDKQSVKGFNKFRRGLIAFIRDQFSMETLDLVNPQALKYTIKHSNI